MSIFRKISDAELIKELIRRGRVQRLDITSTYYPALEHDDKYMEFIDKTMVRDIGTALHNKLYIKIADKPKDEGAEVPVTERTAQVMVIVPEGVTDEC